MGTLAKHFLKIEHMCEIVSQRMPGGKNGNFPIMFSSEDRRKTILTRAKAQAIDPWKDVTRNRHKPLNMLQELYSTTKPTPKTFHDGGKRGIFRL